MLRKVVKMITLDELATNDEIKAEYRKTFLLNIFQKTCVRMERDLSFKAKVKNLFRQSYNKVETVQAIIKNELNYDLSTEDAEIMLLWFEANLRKAPRRKSIPASIKEELYKKQNGKCMVCGEDLGTDWSKIHVDHIIPWKLVGDELPDNYQDLCETCNECKSARTDYIFKSMIKLI